MINSYNYKLFKYKFMLLLNFIRNIIFSIFSALKHNPKIYILKYQLDRKSFKYRFFLLMMLTRTDFINITNNQSPIRHLKTLLKIFNFRKNTLKENLLIPVFIIVSLICAAIIPIAALISFLICNFCAWLMMIIDMHSYKEYSFNHDFKSYLQDYLKARFNNKEIHIYEVIINRSDTSQEFIFKLSTQYNLKDPPIFNINIKINNYIVFNWTHIKHIEYCINLQDNAASTILDVIANKSDIYHF